MPIHLMKHNTIIMFMTVIGIILQSPVSLSGKHNSKNLSSAINMMAQNNVDINKTKMLSIVKSKKVASIFLIHFKYLDKYLKTCFNL